jgi:hypothetical protein
MIVNLYVDVPVSSLQFDLETDGDIVLAPGIPKDAITNRIGKILKVIVFRMNIGEFSGLFAAVNTKVAGISNVEGAKADATDAGANVLMLSQIAAADISVSVQ